MAIDRQKVFNKYDGHCAYCGDPILIDHFHVDHIEAKRRDDNYGGSDDIDNLNPACSSCNLYKKVFTIKEFRYELQADLKRIKKLARFRRLIRYGQIEITEKPIKFYFEESM